MSQILPAEVSEELARIVSDLGPNEVDWPSRAEQVDVTIQLEFDGQLSDEPQLLCHGVVTALELVWAVVQQRIQSSPDGRPAPEHSMWFLGDPSELIWSISGPVDATATLKLDLPS